MDLVYLSQICIFFNLLQINSTFLEFQFLITVLYFTSWEFVDSHFLIILKKEKCNKWFILFSHATLTKNSNVIYFKFCGIHSKNSRGQKLLLCLFVYLSDIVCFHVITFDFLLYMITLVFKFYFNDGFL